MIQQAIGKVTGFELLYKELERSLNVSGKSSSALTITAATWRTWHCIISNCQLICWNRGSISGVTLPDSLNRLCLYKPAILYKLLFATAWSVLNSFGHDPKWLGAQAGMISILHTWGQTMTLYPPVHCLVPGGGLTKPGKWKTAKSDGKYLFNVKAMSKVYRGRFIDALRQQLPAELTKNLIPAL